MELKLFGLEKQQITCIKTAGYFCITEMVGIEPTTLAYGRLRFALLSEISGKGEILNLRFFLLKITLIL